MRATSTRPRLDPAAAPTRARAPTQTQSAHEALHARIMNGAIAPGAKLNIVSLAGELQVSPGAVREALGMLVSQELVVAEPQRGFRAAGVSAQDLSYLTQARVEVEKLCLAEAMTHGGIEWESALVGALHRLMRLSRAGRAPRFDTAWIDAHAEFHRTLVSGCPNPWLLNMRQTQFQQSERYRQLSNRAGAYKRDGRAEHRALVDALLARDRPRVDRLITEHLTRTAQLVMASLPAAG